MKIKIRFLVLLLTSNFSLLAAVFSAPPGIDVGNKSVDFSLKVLSSTETFKLSKYNGKNPVLVNFFATWCPYCVREVPELNELQKKYAPKGLIIVSVNVQEKEEKILRFVKKKKAGYNILLDTTAEVAEKFKVYGIPTNILINSKGIIVFRSYNLPDKKEIEKILPKPKKNKRR